VPSFKKGESMPKIHASIICLLIFGASAMAQQPPVFDAPSPAVFLQQAQGQSSPMSIDSTPSEKTLSEGAVAANPKAGSGEAGGGGGEAGNGTDPSEVARRFNLSNEYIELGNRTVLNTTTARFVFPAMGGRAKLGVDIPFNYYDLKIPNLGTIGGLGDIKFSLTYNLWLSENKKFAAITGLESWVPSADTVGINRNPIQNTITFQDIGTGKYRVGPFAALVYNIDKTSLLAALYQHEFSIAGDGTRPDIHRGVVKIFAMKAFQSGFYILTESQILTDFQNGNDLDVYLMPEFGVSKKGTTFFFKPGFGINPDANNRYIGVNFGIRLVY
jgi:hypothetical protein